MTRFYFRLIMIPILIFTAVLILIHVQPYDDHELRELLLPEGCPAPCFMGIRPGVTTEDEAIKILETSEWVESVEKGSIYNGADIVWHWSNQKPKGIDSKALGYMTFFNDHVTWIKFDTNISVGEVRLVLGSPDTQNVNRTEEDEISEYILYSANYYQRGLSINNTYPCKVIEPLRGTVSMLMSEALYSYSLFYDKSQFGADTLSDIFHTC